MRKSGNWMTVWDDRILEYIYNNGTATPTEIANSEFVHVTAQHISNRLQKLHDHELVESLGNGVYQITTTGSYYLAGGYDAETGTYMHNVSPEDGLYNFDRPVLWAKRKYNQLRSK
jgi:predicted transcriptional regulator